jgi:hypothetical protein
MIILDSDIFTLLTYEHPNVVRHYEAVPDDERLAVTTVTRKIGVSSFFCRFAGTTTTARRQIKSQSQPGILYPSRWTIRPATRH